MEQFFYYYDFEDYVEKEEYMMNWAVEKLEE